MANLGLWLHCIQRVNAALFCNPDTALNKNKLDWRASLRIKWGPNFNFWNINPNAISQTKVTQNFQIGQLRKNLFHLEEDNLPEYLQEEFLKIVKWTPLQKMILK